METLAALCWLMLADCSGLPTPSQQEREQGESVPVDDVDGGILVEIPPDWRGVFGENTGRI